MCLKWEGGKIYESIQLMNLGRSVLISVEEPRFLPRVDEPSQKVKMS